MEQYETEALFEKSQLGQYLHGLDLMNEDFVRQDVIVVQEPPSETPPSRLTLYCRAFQRYVWDHVKGLFGLTRRDSSKMLFCHEAVKTILQSQLMLRKDYYHVEFILSSTSSPTHVHRSVTSALVRSVSAAIFAVLCCKRRCFRTLGLTVSLLGLLTCTHWYKNRSRRMKLRQLRSLLCLQQEYIEHLRKSLCLIQANDFLETDKTVISGVSSKLRGDELFHNITPVLYSSVEEALLSATQFLHCSTNTMLTKVPVSPLLDNTDSYLCSTSWSEIQESELPSNVSGMKQIQKLRSMYQLVLSEFLRRLGLSLCYEVWKDMSADRRCTVWRLLEDITWRYKRQNHNLLKCHWLYKDYKVYDAITDNSAETLALDWQFIDCYSVFQNSLQHLKQAVHASLDVKNIVISTCFQENNLLEEENKNVIPRVLELMSEIVVHLDNCNSSVKSSIKKLNYVHKQKVQTDKTVEDVVDAKENGALDVKQIQVGFTDLDPEGEYEIFEEYIEDSFKDDDKDDGDFFTELLEETRNRLSKKVHNMMYTELQDALKSKIEEIKSREAEALKRKRGSNQQSNADEDSHSQPDEFEPSEHDSSPSLGSIDSSGEVTSLITELETVPNIRDTSRNKKDRDYNRLLTEPQNTVHSPYDKTAMAAQAALISQCIMANKQHRVSVPTPSGLPIPTLFSPNAHTFPVTGEEETFCYVPDEDEDTDTADEAAD